MVLMIWSEGLLQRYLIESRIQSATVLSWREVSEKKNIDSKPLRDSVVSVGCSGRCRSNRGISNFRFEISEGQKASMPPF